MGILRILINAPERDIISLVKRANSERTDSKASKVWFVGKYIYITQHRNRIGTDTAIYIYIAVSVPLLIV